MNIVRIPGCLKTRERAGTIFMNRNTLRYSQIDDRFIFFFTEDNYKISASSIKEKQRYKRLNTAKSFIPLLIPGSYTHLLKAAFHFRVFHTHVYARKTLNRREH